MMNKTALHKLISGRNTAQKVVMRAKIVLAHQAGHSKVKIAKDLKVSRPTIDVWLKRYKEHGVAGLLKDATRPGRKPQIDAIKEKQIVEATLQTTPKGATHWSNRTLAEKQGVSKMTIQRIWKKYNLKPHLVKGFKVSKDKKFIEKVTDIVGLYINPPQKALVFSVDEKSQIQALDRTQPGLPMKKGRLGTMTHDYKRNGTSTLFAALNMYDGSVIGKCYERHTHKEFLKFLRTIDKQIATDLDIHIIADNYSTHKTDEVKLWLTKHPRFHIHFTPTSASWINMVERFFSKITVKMIRRSSFNNTEELDNAILNFIAVHNENPKVYTWTKDADTIIAKWIKCKEALGALH
jgi:transposase